MRRAIVALSAVLGLAGFSPRIALAADQQCGTQGCEESICSSPDVIECSDWNDNSYDGWATSKTDRKGGDRGDVKPGVGLNGTAGWAHRIIPGSAETIHFDKAVGSLRGPLHARLYVKFSPNFKHRMICGLQKIFYLLAEADGRMQHRIQLGAWTANRVPSLSHLPDSVGIFGFDYTGHHVELPDEPGDRPVPIEPGRWYSVEIMVKYESANQNIVRLWIDGELQMERRNYADSYYGGAAWSRVQDTSWFGGADTCSHITEEQWVYKDNHVLSTSYIGPIGGSPPPAALEPLGTPGQPRVVEP